MGGDISENYPSTANPLHYSYNGSSYIVTGMEAPQQLSRQAIEDFRAIYQEEFGVALSDDEVQEIALRLLRFFGILAKPGE